MSSNSSSRIGTWPSVAASIDCPAHDPFVGDRHDQVGAEAGGPVQQQDSGTTLDRVARREREHRFLVRLVERDVDEPHVLAEQPCASTMRARGTDLVGSQRRQRMIRCRERGLVDGLDGGGAHRGVLLSVDGSAGARSQRGEYGAAAKVPTSSTPITAAVVLEPPTSSGRLTTVITSSTARPTSPRPGAITVCQVLVSTRVRRKYTTTAMDVSVISAMMPTEETPANQANTCGDGVETGQRRGDDEDERRDGLHHRRDVRRRVLGVRAAAPRRQRSGVAEREDVAGQHVVEGQQRREEACDQEDLDQVAGDRRRRSGWRSR